MRGSVYDGITAHSSWVKDTPSSYLYLRVVYKNRLFASIAAYAGGKGGSNGGAGSDNIAMLEKAVPGVPGQESMP
jgi:hypothetical protein